MLYINNLKEEKSILLLKNEAILDAVDELKEQGFIKEQQDSEKVRFFFCHDSIQKFVQTSKQTQQKSAGSG